MRVHTLPSRAISHAQARSHRPFFIVGCPRSGTSVLARMLGRHPELAIPYESHLYNRLYPLVRRYGAPSGARGRARLMEAILDSHYVRHWSPRPSLPASIAAMHRDDFHGLVGGLLSAWAAQQGKSRWGEKTPQHAFWWREIAEGFPDLQLVHVIRDGRDVALSYRKAHFGPKHVHPLARRWVAYLDTAEEARAALGTQKFLAVRYEDLLVEPERELRRVCEFLGVAYDPVTLTHDQESAPYPTDRLNERNLRRPLLTENAGKWRSEMTARELRIFEALAGKALERYGYARARPDARVSRWEEWSCRFVEHPPRRLLAMLRNRQGAELLLERVRLTRRLRRGAFQEA